MFPDKRAEQKAIRLRCLGSSKRAHCVYAPFLGHGGRIWGGCSRLLSRFLRLGSCLRAVVFRCTFILFVFVFCSPALSCQWPDPSIGISTLLLCWPCCLVKQHRLRCVHIILFEFFGCEWRCLELLSRYVLWGGRWWQVSSREESALSNSVQALLVSSDSAYAGR